MKRILLLAALMAATSTSAMAQWTDSRDVGGLAGSPGPVAKPGTVKPADPYAWRNTPNMVRAYVMEVGESDPRHAIHALYAYCWDGQRVLGYAGMANSRFVEGEAEYRRMVGDDGLAFRFPREDGVRLTLKSRDHRELAHVTLSANTQVAGGPVFRLVLSPAQLNALRAASYIVWENTGGLGNIEFSGNNSASSLAALINIGTGGACV